MVWSDVLNAEDEKELKDLLNLNELIEEKLEKAINFFQKISSKYEIRDYVECLSSFFMKVPFNLNSHLSSFFLWKSSV